MTTDLITGKRRTGKRSLIVAIGASAGGLKPLQSFLDALPKEFGFALVFIQHLSAKYKNLLAELCQARRPDLDFVEIADNLPILPGRLYLCPPGQFVTIRDGSFRVTMPAATGHLQLPIDEFFISLAGEAGEKAIAVIFSGAGTDGARGVGAIRSQGGTVFVQDPETAEFPGMPLAAIGTGQVDMVLPPADISREIVKTLAAAALAAGVESLATAAQLQSLFRLIYEKTGHRFEHYKHSVIMRRIKRRISLHGLSSLTDYLKLVGNQEAEAALLAADIMIGVTSFYRDQAAWATLRRDIVGRFGTADEDVPIRVWTPACATGEEAYSIAMMLCYEFERACRRKEVQVFATDVNDKALDKAREGRYPGSVTADIPSEYMRRFFAGSDDGISVLISKELRERVVFARQDLLVDPPFSRLDLIICRNLLIYLEPEAQARCISLFHYALKDGGYLFLGNAESTTRNNNLFKSLGYKKCRIYQKIEGSSAARLPVAVPLADASPPAPHAASTRQSLNGFIQEALLESHAPAAVAINQNYEILYHNGPTQRYLRQPRGTPTQNLLELLPESLRNRLRGGLYRATAEGRPVSVSGEIAGDEESRRRITLRIAKLRDDLFLIVFLEPLGFPDQAGDLNLSPADLEETAARQLEGELAATKDALQSTIEQLRSMNEELQSSNEELHAANEELETSREELQSVNEELITVNGQLQAKIEEQEETNNDLNNFLASTNIPTLFLDHQFKLKRFTPAMSRLLKLLPSDVGRPIIDMSQESLGPEFIADAREVLDSLVSIKKELLINGVWYVRATLPYRTSDDRVEGVVVTYTNVTELKYVEAQTRHLASFPQLNPNPVLEVDASGKLSFVNPSAENILERLGLDKREAAVFLPRDLDVILKDLDKGRESSFSREVIIKDRVFGETVQLIPQFNVVRIYVLDITGRKRAEEALEQARSEAEFRAEELQAVLDNASAAIWIAHDPQCLRITGNRYADELIMQVPRGANVSTSAPPGEGAVYFRVFRGGVELQPEELPAQVAAATGKPVADEVLELQFSNGRSVYLLEGAVPLLDAQGMVRGSIASAMDVTPLRRAEERLRASEQRLKFHFENSPLAVVEWNADFIVTQWSNEAERIFGWKKEEALDKRIDTLNLIYEADIPLVNATMERLAGGKEPVVVSSNRNLTKAGAVIECAWYNTVLLNENGQMASVMSLVQDVTARKQAEQALCETNEELTRINSAMEGRELRMIELKKEINELRSRAGEPPPYPLAFEEEEP